MEQFRLRTATPEDARALLTVHRASVRGLAAKDYDAAIIEDWAGPITPDKVVAYQRRIASGEEITVIAEGRSGILGFGELVESNVEVRAVYVLPSASRSGVGTAILERLETIARGRGLGELNLEASLTAEPFYLHHGYQSLNRGEHELNSGTRMMCVKMRKAL